MKKWIAIVLLLALLTGCSSAPVMPTGETADFTDDAGRTVRLPAEIGRIVPSGPLAQIFLLAIAPDLFVGLASRFDSGAEGIIAKEILELPYLGQLYDSSDLNVEELAAVAPQLIIDIGEAKPTVKEDLDALTKQTGIPAVHIAATLETVPQTYRRLGALLGREERGEALAQFCERTLQRTHEIVQKVGENKVKGLYVTGEDGLHVIAQGSYHAELLDLLIDNLAVVESPSSKGLGNAVDMEQIALWNPDFVVFAPGSIYANVEEQPAWGQITAIAQQRYVEVPGAPYNWLGMPPAVQRYLGMIWLTAMLYPEYCDYDVRAEICEYYRLFYGCELSEEQYVLLTANASFTA